MTTTDSLIADLEAGLAAAKALAAADTPQPAASATPAVDTSMMPGGADSAPVGAVEATMAPVAKEIGNEVTDVEHAAGTEGLDLIHELKEGKAVKEVAGLLHDVKSSNAAVESIVQAISDLAQGVRI